MKLRRLKKLKPYPPQIVWPRPDGSWGSIHYIFVDDRKRGSLYFRPEIDLQVTVLPPLTVELN